MATARRGRQRQRLNSTAHPPHRGAAPFRYHAAAGWGAGFFRGNSVHDSNHRPVAAGVLLLLLSGAALAAEPTGHDASRVQSLSGLPVHIVMLNDHVRSQIAYAYRSVASDAVTQQAIQNAMVNTPGLSAGQGIAAGALGGAIASAIINAQLQAAAKNQVEPADATMRASRCMVDYGQELGAALQRAVNTSTWGQAATVERHLVGPRQKVADVVDPDRERYVLTASYSISPDYSALVTTVNASAYSPRLGQQKKWQRDPAWTDELVVVSDRILVPAKSPADIDAAVAAENSRYAQLGVPALIAKANAGDPDARTKAVKLMKEHKRALEEARETSWSPAFEAEQRARLWSADGCARLRATLASNTSETETLLGQLYRGELPARISEVSRELPALLPADARQVRAEAIGIYRMARGDGEVPLAYRFSWLPEPDAE